jgi:hypothetical protein
LIQIDGLVLAYAFAKTTFLLFKVKTAFIDIRDQRDGLCEINMDCFVFRYFLIKLIRVFDGTVFYAGRATRAFALKNISRLFSQRYSEVSFFSLYTVNFGVGEDLYIRMPADLDQFGREYSDGAVIGRKSLVELGHMTANGWSLVDQVNFEAGPGKIKRGLNATDPSADHHHISKITVSEGFRNLF